MSDQPDLIEPVTVKLQQIDKDNTPYSAGISGRHEAINYIERKTEVELKAQVVFVDRKQQLEFHQLGAEEQVKGYCVFRYKDLTAKGVTIERGDKIVQVGQLTGEWYVLHGQGDPAAHFSSIGGFTLTRIFFGDREPVGG